MSFPVECSRQQDLDLLVELVSTPSVSGGERAASEVFVRHARARGLVAHVDDVSNAIAVRGSIDGSDSVHIVMLGHIDTVPGHIDVRIADGVLHGRGSVDAKGPLCAMLAAAGRASLHPSVRLSVIGAAGEETSGSPGARHILHSCRPDACIIGEPSGWDGVTLGYKGRLIVEVTSTKSASHSAGPETTAADDLFAWWSLVVHEIAEFNRGVQRVFDQIQAKLERLNSEADGLGHAATLRAGFRLPPSMPPYALEARLRALPGAGLRLSFSGMEIASCTARNDPVVRALTAGVRACGGTPRPILKTGTADLNVVAPVWKCPIAAYGPGDSDLDHTPREHLSIDEYHRSIDVLIRAIESLSGELVRARVSEEGVRV